MDLVIWPNLYNLMTLTLGFVYILDAIILFHFINQLCPSPRHHFSPVGLAFFAVFNMITIVGVSLLLFGHVLPRHDIHWTPDIPGYDGYWTLRVSTLFCVWIIPFWITGCICLIFYRPQGRHDEGVLIISDDAPLARRILACENIDEKSLKSSPSQLHCRNLPNARLFHIFGMDNAFTTLDNSWRKEFKNKSITAMTPLPVTSFWRSLSDLARETCLKKLQFIEPGQSHDLAPLIREITLRLTLAVFFPDIDPRQVSSTSLNLIAEKINILCLASKSTDSAYEAPKWEDQHALRALLELATGVDFSLIDARSNPLNFLVPAYETLWRVVFRCVVEVVFRFRPEAAQWRRLLTEYLAYPNTTRVDQQGIDGVSPRMLAKEALRLYPPTRRVYREYRMDVDGAKVEKKVAVDVEALQRKKAIRGPRPHTFDPSRWSGPDCPAENEAFLAFGAGSFQCPARVNFAPKALALLVAAVSTVVGDDWVLKSRKPEDEIEAGQPMDTDRDSHGSLYLLKKAEGIQTSSHHHS